MEEMRRKGLLSAGLGAAAGALLAAALWNPLFQGRDPAGAPLAEALGCLRQEWAAEGKWEIATQSPGEEAPLCETLDPDAPEEERRAVVCRHLSRFFPAAPEAIREGGEDHGSLPESGGLPGGPGVSEEGG